MTTKLGWMAAVFMILSLVLVANGCGNSSSQPTPVAQAEMVMSEGNAEIGEPYKVGVVTSVTGGASSLGIPERNTFEMLEAKLNAAGGIQGPDGLMHPVEYIIYDDESDETKAVLAVKKLIEEDKVSIILGPTTSGNTLAAVDTIQKAEIPMIAMAASIKIVQPIEERRWAFKVTWNDSLLADKAAQYLEEQGLLKVGWLSANNAYGDSGLVEFQKAAANHGLEIVTLEKFDQGDTDMTAQLTKIRGTDAQALVIWSTLPECAIAVKNAHDLGMDLPSMVIGGSTHPRFLELATTEAAEGTLTCSGKASFKDELPDSDPQKEIIREYFDEYIAEFGETPDHFGGHARDAFYIVADALGKVGADRAALRDEIENLTGFVGITGIFAMTETDHNGLGLDALSIAQIVGGEWHLVAP